MGIQQENEIVLGIDPGIQSTGWAVLNHAPGAGGKPRVMSYGVIKTYSRWTFERRVKKIRDDLTEVAELYHPGRVVIEGFVMLRGRAGAQANFNRSAFKTGVAVGAAVAACGDCSVELVTPGTIQRRLNVLLSKRVSTREARKAVMARVVRELTTGLDGVVADHITDAVGLALAG